MKYCIRSYLDFPFGAAKWMMFWGTIKHHPIEFKEHPNWKMLVDLLHRFFCQELQKMANETTKELNFLLRVN